MPRPRDWYEMTYDQQREWERNERRHKQELEDVEYERDRLRNENEAEQMRRRREAAAMREDLSDLSADRDTAYARAQSMENFIRHKGLMQEYEAWKGED